ncbi:hypothetical protein [Ramlibacter sp. AN1133]|uniref:hypothetical protein n=1 Tax=Ramlibacter sp. AN1133 TaxID=3133429 RepID=UPI0030BF41B5
MTHIRIPRLAAAAGLALCTAATAQVFSSRDHEARELRITARYRTAVAACAPLEGHGEDVCLAEAEAEERIARVDLEAQYRPSAKARHHALVVAADSRYAVARVRCEDRTGVARDACMTAATALRTAERDQARVLLNNAAARARATEQADDDREEASSDTLAARYSAARMQCEAYVDKLRERCLTQTRNHFLKQP